jgi:glycosyltransferase involved in cell wall biosynthesis
MWMAMGLKLGVVYDGQRNFLEELIEDWQGHFETRVHAFRPVNFPVAKGRINPLLHRRWIKQVFDQSDVVFFEWAGENLVAASRMPHRAAVVARLHSWELFHHAKWVNWKGVDRIVLVSQAMQRRFNEMYPGNEERTVVLPAGKSLTRFAPVQHAFTGKIAMLGHLIPVKRVYEMVLTLAALRERGADVSLHLGGKPEEDFSNQRYYASLLSAVKKLGLSQHVFFDGWVDSAAWLPGMDIFISNSYWEGQQNALIEAMASGCYCLSHFWDGAEEILSPEYLYTTETALVDKIIDYTKVSEDTRRQHQDCLRSVAMEKYNLLDSIHQYRALIETVGGQPNAKR